MLLLPAAVRVNATGRRPTSDDQSRTWGGRVLSNQRLAVDLGGVPVRRARSAPSGQTELDNMALVCPFHHLIHDAGWKLTRAARCDLAPPQRAGLDHQDLFEGDKRAEDDES